MADWTCGKCVAATTEQQPAAAEEPTPEEEVDTEHLPFGMESTEDDAYVVEG